MRYVLVLCLALLTSCQSCGAGTPVQIAQRFMPGNGFHVLAAAGGELQAYPHALYYSGQGLASVAWAYGGRALHTLEFEPGAAQFRLIEVDQDTGKVRLLAATCEETHARGHFPWIECAGIPEEKTIAQALLEYDPKTGTLTP